MPNSCSTMSCCLRHWAPQPIPARPILIIIAPRISNWLSIIFSTTKMSAHLSVDNSSNGSLPANPARDTSIGVSKLSMIMVPASAETCNPSSRPSFSITKLVVQTCSACLPLENSGSLSFALPPSPALFQVPPQLAEPIRKTVSHLSPTLLLFRIDSILGTLSCSVSATPLVNLLLLHRVMDHPQQPH